MTGQLQHVGDEGPARCALCGELAAGPCARCRRPTCGDCCVLVEGVKVWAICLDCERKGGRSVAPGWTLVLLWIGLPIAGLALIVALLYGLAR